MRTSSKIVLASTNRHKFEEFKALFAAYPEFEVIPANQIIRNATKLSMVENYASYQENSLAKARKANQASHYPALADDSGLEVEALNGGPGPRTARYAIPKAGMSQDQANIEKLLEEMKGASGDKRRAHFVAALSLAMEGVHLSAIATMEGRIAEAPRGKSGFGYDPVFIPAGQDRTLAEMSEDEKNSISHRALALHDLMNKLKARGVVLAKP